MKNMRPFQVILMGVFLALGIGGVVVFALFKVGTSSNPYGSSVVIWGTLDDAPFVAAIGTIKEVDPNFSVVQYVEKDERTFEQDLLNALAEGTGPDLIVVPQDLLLGNKSKIQPITFVQFPERVFRDTYIDGAEIFLGSDGIYGIPMSVDPLLMYWNRDIFASKGLANPPRTWEEMIAVTVPATVERSFSYDILRATVAFGEYVNIRNAKAVIAMLFMQSGSNMVVERGGRMYVELNQGTTQGLAPAVAALRFFSEFSNPTKTTYTWNRALRGDRDMFLAGDLALYFGFAGEWQEIRDGNPNLNFDVADVPQGSESHLKKGYGKFYGLALTKNSRNQVGATAALYNLIARPAVESYATALRLGLVHRDSLSTLPSDPFLAVVGRAALVARGWLDPSARASDNIFKQMVEDVSSGRMEADDAVEDAEGRLRQLIER